MWTYNQATQPPAPFLDIIIHHPTESTHVNIQAKLDTGADISALPVEIVSQLQLPLTSRMIVEGYDGRPNVVFTYSAVLEIVQVRFRSREFITVPESYALLGRDILNHLYVHLNGPELTFDLRQTPS